MFKDIRETREVESVLYDMVYKTHMAPVQDKIFTPEVVQSIKDGKRLVVGQLVILITKDANGTVLTKAPCIVRDVLNYNTDTPGYAVKILLGSLNSKDDITKELDYVSFSDEYFDTNIEQAIKDYITKSVLATKDTLAFKKSIGISHIFVLENSKYTSLF